MFFLVVFVRLEWIKYKYILILYVLLLVFFKHWGHFNAHFEQYGNDFVKTFTKLFYINTIDA